MRNKKIIGLTMAGLCGLALASGSANVVNADEVASSAFIDCYGNYYENGELVERGWLTPTGNYYPKPDNVINEDGSMTAPAATVDSYGNYFLNDVLVEKGRLNPLGKSWDKCGADSNVDDNSNVPNTDNQGNINTNGNQGDTSNNQSQVTPPPTNGSKDDNNNGVTTDTNNDAEGKPKTDTNTTINSDKSTEKDDTLVDKPKNDTKPMVNTDKSIEKDDKQVTTQNTTGLMIKTDKSVQKPTNTKQANNEIDTKLSAPADNSNTKLQLPKTGNKMDTKIGNIGAIIASILGLISLGIYFKQEKEAKNHDK